MDLDAVAELTIDPVTAFAAVEDLATYPHWLTIVGTAEPAPPHPADAAEADEDGPGPAWTIELVGRVGPFSRTKRVRMLRTHRDPAAGRVRFERHEHDGRAHNRWVLTGEVRPHPSGTTRPGSKVHVHLHYGGGRSLPGADLLLRQEARRAGERLERYLLRKLE